MDSSNDHVTNAIGRVHFKNSCISSFYSKNLYSNFTVVLHLPKDAYSQNFSPLAQTGAEISAKNGKKLKWEKKVRRRRRKLVPRTAVDIYYPAVKNSFEIG